MKQVVVVLLFLVSSVYADYGSPFRIPGLVESVTPYLMGNETAPLLAVNASASEYLARDPTGVLQLVQRIIGNASEPVSILLDGFKIAYSSTMMSQVDALLPLYRNVLIASGAVLSSAEVATSAELNVRTYAAKLSGKISPSVYDAIIQAISDFTDSLIRNDGPLVALGPLYTAVVQSITSVPPATASTISDYVTPELVSLQAPALARLVLAIKNLAKALQMAVTEINLSLVDPAILSRLPNIVPVLVNFNAAANSTRNSLTQTASSLVNNATTAFSSVTSNPSSWNDGNIVNLTTFLANVTALMQNNFTQSLGTAIDSVKTNVFTTLTSQIQQLAATFDRVYTNILATSASSNSRFKVRCSSKYSANLLSMVATMSRLGNCIQRESNALDVIKSHAKEAIKKANAEAIKLMNQLQLCRAQSGVCVKQIFDSFPIQYQNAVTALALITDYTTSGLWAIAGRVADCTADQSDEIATHVQILRIKFNRCLAFSC